MLDTALTDIDKRSAHQRRGEETAVDNRICVWLEDRGRERGHPCAAKVSEVCGPWKKNPDGLQMASIA